MGYLLDYAPIAATAFAVPHQILKLRATDDSAGVSWSWATLTSVNNAAWIAYFALSGFWTALVPASSAMLLAGALATMLALRGRARAQPAVLISSWFAYQIATGRPSCRFFTIATSLARCVESRAVDRRASESSLTGQWKAPMSAPPTTMRSAATTVRLPINSLRPITSAAKRTAHNDPVALSGETTLTRPRSSAASSVL